MLAWLSLIGLSLLSSAAAIGFPFCQRAFIDQLAHPRDTSVASMLAMIIAGASLYMVSVGLAEQLRRVALGIAIRKHRVWARRLRQFVQRSAGDSLGRLNIGRVLNHLNQDIPAICQIFEEALPIFASVFWPVLLAPIVLQKLAEAPIEPIFLALIPGLVLSVCLAVIHARLFWRLKLDNDRRISASKEFLDILDGLRMLAWESVLTRKVTAARRVESRGRLLMAANGSLMNVIAQTIPGFLNVYTLYLVSKQYGVFMTAGQLFSIFWVCSVFLAKPLRMLSVGVVFLLDGWTSRQRILKSFADQEELPAPISSIGPLINDPSMLEPGLTVVSGPTGSGKTRMIRQLSEHFGKAAATCDDRTYFIEGDVATNVALKEGLSKHERVRIAEILEDLGLSSLNTQGYVVSASGANLSGGMKQRLALARAAFADRMIILLDHSLSGLDKVTQTQVEKRFFNSRWHGRSIVLAADDETRPTRSVRSIKLKVDQ